MTRIEEAKRLAKSLDDDPSIMVDDEGAESIDLPAKPTVEQLRSALIMTRFEAGQTLQELVAEVESIGKELDKLGKELDKFRNHRHDFSKTFSGRAEF